MIQGYYKQTKPAPLHPLERYYRFHSRIYDATRWSFLFGRDRLVKIIAKYRQPSRILDVGCGTGKNLLRLRQVFPGANLTGLDLSDAMLAQAKKKLAGCSPEVQLVHRAYDQPLLPESPFDLLVFSYALSMFNPGWDQAIGAAHQELAPDGTIAVVDFHTSSRSLFKHWMALNHVRMEGHLLPELESRFTPIHKEIRPAYGGIWYYMLFIGKKTRG
jgi:S-adenosylmethionine-diacylgycerolhomoserine-N-methlytransferase